MAIQMLTDTPALRFWVDVTTARFHHIKADADNPLLAATGGVTGLDLALWSISTIH